MYHFFYRTDLESETDTDEFEKISQDAADSKLASFEKPLLQQKQLEVGSLQSTSPYSSLNSTKSSSSPLTRSSLSSELTSFQIPSLVGSGLKQPLPQLSPLTECVEGGDLEPTKNLESDNSFEMRPQSLSVTILCDPPNKSSQSPSNGNSPAIKGGTGNEFFGTEFYIDESLPSSLSEPQEEAFVSLLQVLMPRTIPSKMF